MKRFIRLASQVLTVSAVVGMQFPISAFAQESCARMAKDGTVSLDSCRRMAVKNNKMLKVADETVRSVGYERKAARAAYLPGIDFNGGYMYNQRKISLLSEDAKLPTMLFNPLTQSYDYNILVGLDGQPVKDPATGSYIPLEVAVIPKDAMTFDTHNVVAGAFTLTQPIFMGGQIKALNDIASFAEKAAVSARDNAVQELILGVDQAYWQVVSLNEKKRLAESFVTLVDSLRNNVEAMLKEGVATRSDMLTVDVRYNEAQIALTKVENGLTLSRMALAQLCGLPVDTKMELDDESWMSCPKESCAPVDIEEVYSRRADLEVLRQGINVLKGKERLTMGDMLPKVALVGAYSFSNPNLNDGFRKRFGGGFNVGATLTVPLWHWGGNYNRYRAAKAATNAQRFVLEDAEEKVSLQVSQARFSYQEAIRTLDMTFSNMAKANENLHQAEMGFKEGVLTADDVLGAQTAWLKANSEKIDAGIGVRLCEVYLSKVLGNLNY